MTPTETFLLITGCLAFGGMLISLGMMLYTVHTQLDDALEIMSQRSGCIKRTPHASGSRGKLILMGELMGCVVFSSFRRRLDSSQTAQTDHLPAPFRRTLIIHFWTSLIIASLVMLYGLNAHHRWLE